MCLRIFFKQVKENLPKSMINKSKNFMIILAQLMKNLKKQKSKNYQPFFLSQLLFKMKIKIWICNNYKNKLLLSIWKCFLAINIKVILILLWIKNGISILCKKLYYQFLQIFKVWMLIKILKTHFMSLWNKLLKIKMK